MRGDWTLVDRRRYWDIKESTTELDRWEQWRNNFTSKQVQNYGKRIKVVEPDDELIEVLDDWLIKGRYSGERQWFNQQMVKRYGRDWESTDD